MTTIAPFLEMARAGHREAALHGLIELGDVVLPRLGEAYRAEPDPDVRSLLVEAIWQIRSPASLDLLGEALQDPAPEVWREALDGLSTLASPESLRILESARDGLAVSDEEEATATATTSGSGSTGRSRTCAGGSTNEGEDPVLVSRRAEDAPPLSSPRKYPGARTC